jgi:hypothetical protein
LQHNVGKLLWREVHDTRNYLCGPCLGSALRHHQLHNLVFGWWGVISVFVTVYFLVVNVIAWADARRRLALAAAELDRKARVDVWRGGAAGPGSGGPPFADGSIEAFPVAASRELAPFLHNVRMRLGAGESAAEIGRDLARTHGVGEPEALRFVDAVRATA